MYSRLYIGFSRDKVLLLENVWEGLPWSTWPFQEVLSSEIGSSLGVGWGCQAVLLNGLDVWSGHVVLFCLYRCPLVTFRLLGTHMIHLLAAQIRINWTLSMAAFTHPQGRQLYLRRLGCFSRPAWPQPGTAVASWPLGSLLPFLPSCSLFPIPFLLSPFLSGCAHLCGGTYTPVPMCGRATGWHWECPSTCLHLIFRALVSLYLGLADSAR